MGIDVLVPNGTVLKKKKENRNENSNTCLCGTACWPDGQRTGGRGSQVGFAGRRFGDSLQCEGLHRREEGFETLL